MAPPIVMATIQAALLSGLSNILAQGIQAYRSERSFILNITQLLQFVIFALISCPPNFIWQEFLEDQFPAKEMRPDGGMRLHRTNTATKFALDQTLGAFVNTALFIAGVGAFKGKARSAVVRDCKRDIWPLMKDGWKLWPLVSILNFTVVPARNRVLVGNIVGLFWGTYLSLFAAS